MNTLYLSSSSSKHTLLDSYIIHDNIILGNGATSVVKLGTHIRTNKSIAVKVVDIKLDPLSYRREVEILAKLNHPHIVRFLGNIKRGSKGIIFMERVQATLRDYLVNRGGVIPHGEIVEIMLQLVDAMQYVHGIGYYHSDLKPENFAYNPLTRTVKIFDFGYSKRVHASDPITKSARWSPLFMAPERLLGRKHNPYPTEVWSLGITFFPNGCGKDTFW